MLGSGGSKISEFIAIVCLHSQLFYCEFLYTVNSSTVYSPFPKRWDLKWKSEYKLEYKSENTHRNAQSCESEHKSESNRSYEYKSESDWSYEYKSESWMLKVVSAQSSYTGWRRLIGSPKLQIISHKRATKYRSLLRKMTYKDKGSHESSPPCISCRHQLII